MRKENRLCPVCGTWFYRVKGTRQIYDKPLCAKVSQSIRLAKRRLEQKNAAA